MKVGINPAVELKEESIRQKREFSDVLRQYVQEDLLSRIAKSKYSDEILIKDFFPWENDSEKIRLYTKNDEIQNVIEELLKADSDVVWSYSIRCEDKENVVGMTAVYMEMQVPITLIIENGNDEKPVIEKKSFKMMLRPVKQVTCNLYHPKAQICNQLYSIIEKLELINDMEAYYVVNELLKSSSISGRNIVDGLTELSKNKPKVLKEQRIDKIESYKSYSYMRKRWDSYCKNHGYASENWETVIERLVSFLLPIWTAVCRNEIFFDDWMPELGRFLG